LIDLQVQPSISGEGLPRTVIEAMANKTPSVVTTTGGDPELVINGETGYIIDIKSFSTAMNKLIDNKNKRIKMGEKAQQYLHNKFSSKQTVNQHIAFFNKLLGN
jgi:glycosyltransferase involved in cell wall biosynthesis